MKRIIDQTFRVAIYLRLSKEDDDLSCSSGAKNESNSISNQRKLIYDFMKSHPEFELYDEYKDATDIIGLKQNPTNGRRFSPIFFVYRAFST